MPEIGQSLPTGQFGPPLRGGSDTEHGRRPWRRALVLVATFLTVVLLTGSVTAGALLWYGQQSIGQITIPSLAPADSSEVAGVEEITDMLNVLVVGDDSRAGMTEEQLQRLGTDEVPGGRTDTVMLLQLDPVTERARLLSFPRDLLVTRCDGSRGRINAAYQIGEDEGIGGPSCLVETIGDLTDIAVHHYVEVNFAGFVDVVDTLGGVTMYIEEPLRDRHAGLDLDRGCQQLDGIAALSFVRARHLDSDFGRMARQQRFIRELTDEVTRAGTLLNVPRLFALVDAVGDAVDTDRDLSLADMRRIAFTLRDLTSDQIDTRTVPATGRTVGGAALQVVKEDEAEELFAAFREGTLAPDHIGREAPGELTVDDVPELVVLNGAGVDGLAAEAADLLERQGFSVSDTSNADDFTYERSVVRHPPELADDADLVADALGGARIVEAEDDDALTVVVGASFDPDDVEIDSGDATGSPGRAGSPSPSPSPEPEPTFAGAAPASRTC